MANSPFTIAFSHQPLPIIDPVAAPLPMTTGPALTSPDGEKVVITDFYGFTVKNLITGKAQEFYAPDFIDSDYDPIGFSQDSKYFYLIEEEPYDTEPGTQNIFRLDADAMTPVELVITFEGTVRNIEPARDGQSFLVRYTEPGDDEGPGPSVTLAIKTATGTATNLNTSADGTAGNGQITEARIVNGGQFAVFVSTSSNLVAGDTNGVADVFLKNLDTGEVTLVSASPSGAQANGASIGIDVSADGTKILFQSTASNLVANDTNGFQDVFVRDITTGRTTLVSTGANGAQGNGNSSDGVFSPDGRSVAFLSTAADIVPNDNNGVRDAFLKNLATGALIPLSFVQDGGSSVSVPVTARPTFSRDGDVVSFGANSYAIDSAGLLLVKVTSTVSDFRGYGVTVSKGDGSESASYVLDASSRANPPSIALDYDRDGDFQATITAGGYASTPASESLNVKVRAHSGPQTFVGDGTDEVVLLSSGADTANGGAGDDSLFGNGGADDLRGGAGNDVLDGGLGNDVLTGGAGDDTYYLDNPADRVVEAANEGRDTVVASFSTTLGANFENLVLTGTAGVTGTGNGLDNTLTGNGADNTLTGLDGNDTLIGGGGADRLVGGNGDDNYYIDSADDVVVESGGGGTTDRVYVTYSGSLAFTPYTLQDNFERLVLIAGRIGNGNALDNVITGNDAGSTLDGLAGNDILTGGAGEDTLFGGDGRDTLIGGDGNDILRGNSGSDRMIGGRGNDVYYVNEAGDQVIEDSTEVSKDAVFSSIDYTLTDALRIETLRVASNNQASTKLTGNSFANTILGGRGNDVLDGGGGADRLEGGDGNDTYIVDNAGDVIREYNNAGDDTLVTFVGYALDNAAQIETLRFAEGRTSTSLDLTGSAIGQTLVGNGGASRLFGRGGDDTYIVDDVGDQVFEAGNEGNDTVVSTGSYVLGIGQSIETLRLADPTGTAARSLTGNGLANTLIGNAGNNGLDGDGGADRLFGGAGNDIYTVDDAGDLVFENAGEGNDTVRTSVSYVLASGQSIETLQLTGTAALDLLGNELANTLIDNAGNNRLDGSNGDDTLISNGGQDVLLGGRGTDSAVIDRSGATVALRFVMESFGATTTLEGDGTTTASINNITLTGGSGNDRFATLDGIDVLSGGAGDDKLSSGAGDDTLNGGAGNDTLEGGAGIDRMSGGTGNDVYQVDSSNDRVFERAGEGSDSVFSTSHYTLAAGQEIESLRLLSSTGATNFNLIGNEFGQTLVGNAGANRLDGKGGSDVLTGGRGADTFIFANALGAGNVDRVTDFASNDTIWLGKSVFTALAPGQLAESAFKNLDAGAADVNDRILYKQTTGELFYDADGSGSGAAVKFAVLDNKVALSAGDFLVV